MVTVEIGRTCNVCGLWIRNDYEPSYCVLEADVEVITRENEKWFNIRHVPGPDCPGHGVYKLVKVEAGDV